MARQDIITGIDIGTSAVRTVIAQYNAQEEDVRIIGVGEAPTSGMRRGAVIDAGDVAQSIDASLDIAEKMAGVNIKSALISVGGVGIQSQQSKGVIAIGRANGEVTDDDVERVIAAAQAISVPVNTDIVHIIPRSFDVDDHRGIKDPVGMTGVRLEVDAMVVEVPSTHIKNLTRAMEKASIAIDDVIIAPLAAATAVTNKKQKELGVVVISIGAATTSLSVFEEGDMVHTAIVPVGAAHITNDIAIGLRTSIDVAEKIKIEYGTALREHVAKNATIDLSHVDSSEEGHVSHEHVIEIIDARLEEIFQLIREELRSVDKDELLPAGAVITGGGAMLPYVVDFAKKILHLPAHAGALEHTLTGVVDQADEPAYTTAIGLVLWSVLHGHHAQGGSGYGGRILGGISENVDDTVGKVRGWFEKFLP